MNIFIKYSLLLAKGKVASIPIIYIVNYIFLALCRGGTVATQLLHNPEVQGSNPRKEGLFQSTVKPWAS